MDAEFTCMMCGKSGEFRDTEEDVYREYYPTGLKFWVQWVYCKPCDCWTQHPLERSR